MSKDWAWLYQALIEKNLPFIPGADGEPWLNYQSAAVFIQYSAETLEKKARALPKHPAFKGFFKLSDFERIYGDRRDGEKEHPKSSVPHSKPFVSTR